MSRSRKKFARNHQSSWLYGEHAVRAMLAGDRWRAEEVLVSDGPRLEGVAVPDGVRVLRESDARIAELVKTDDHQGLAARMPPYPYAAVADLTRTGGVLILDRVQYPMNFGTMVRSAECFGVRDVLIGTTGQCGVTAAVARMSAGAVFAATIARADDLAAAVRELRAGGVRVFAATLDGAGPCDAVDLTGACGLVIGRESDGVAPAITAACDGSVLIPQTGGTQSLNAAAAAAVLLYERSRQERVAS